MAVTVNYSFDRETRKGAPRHFIKLTDGDTPSIEQPIRMVSCDTPEKSNYAGKPNVSQPKLDRTRDRLQNGFYDTLPKALRDYLIGKLTPEAAQKHIEASQRAYEELEKLVEKRLTKPNGKKMKMAIIPTGQIIDDYGRLLAYIAPWFDDPVPSRDDPRRRTFNLDMVENGWAAFFPVYPSLPSPADMNIIIAAAEMAWDKGRGAWKEFGCDLLLGYEYRMCIKLATERIKDQPGGTTYHPATAKECIDMAFQRICVDMRNMKEVGQYGFAAVPPPYRLWFWESEKKKARKDLGL